MNGERIEEELEKLGRKMGPRASVVPGVIARVSGMRMETVRGTQNTHYRRWIMRGTMGLAACAAVAFVITFLVARPAAVWADVFEKVGKTRTLTFDESVSNKDGTKSESIRVMIKGDILRVEMLEGRVTVGNRSTGKWISVDAAKKQVMMITMARQDFDFYNWMKDFKDGKEERMGEQVVEGRKTLVFKVTRPMPDVRGEPHPTEMILWVDAVTELPMKASASIDGEEMMLTHLKFDEDLNDELFSMAVPEGYKVEDVGGISSDQLKAAPGAKEADKYLLTPGVGMGMLKFGDTKEKVVEVLGKAEKETANGADMQYPSQGLAVYVNPKMGLMIVTAMSKKSAGPFAMNDFAGKTDKGIGMGSTRAEVETAYGKPGRVTDNSGGAGRAVALDYPVLHLQIMVMEDRVASIFMDMPRKVGP